jgi:membrane fusion protein (multidrug efflux system)
MSALGRLLLVTWLGLLAAICSGGRAQTQGAKSLQGGPPPAVTVVTIATKDIAPRHSFIGHVVPIQAVQVVARVTAFIDEVAVAQGSVVKAGQVLFRLENGQYQAAVEAANAQLASAKAALWQAQLAYERASQLVKKNAETQANLDQATATRDQNQASVEAAQANLAQANLNLSYCTISSPIAGRIGAISLTKGNLVTPTTPPLASVNQIDPIRVQFAVSDQLVVTAQQRTNKSAEQIATGLTVQLDLPNGSAYDHEGKIVFLNNQVEAQTGTVGVYADFPNPANVLLPGAYVNVHVRPRHPQERPLVPVAALQREQAGVFVLLVDHDNKVVRQAVQLGQQIGQDYVVEKGLAAGDRVITEGIQKVHPGEVVNPVSAPAQPQSESADRDESANQLRQGG